MPDAEVVFTTGSLHALDLLLGSWPGLVAQVDRRAPRSWGAGGSS
ncbi:pyridoxal-phosphate-dependent transferase [Mycobacterium tuberculosis]|uniref:Pyridoxal-phosphate-dependent transferase n=1 Tax=Mycobacterium tuberculosis TaxID=1773 RepID=A0A0U0QX78_MYCTX|nr:pyridoxal-phosphate-dependent transferase [Mycobacterium tuberculosis]